jgi:hypothetical protein
MERHEALEECERLAVIAHETGLKEDMDAWRAAEDRFAKMDQDFRHN